MLSLSLYIDAQYVIYVSEEVWTSMLAFDVPRLLFLTFHCQMDALNAVSVVDIVDDFHQRITLLALRCRVKEVELDGAFGIYVADDDSRTLIHDSRNVDAFEALQGGSGDGDGVGGRCGEGNRGGIAVLHQVLTKAVAAYEGCYLPAYAALSAELVGATAGK